VKLKTERKKKLKQNELLVILIYDYVGQFFKEIIFHAENADALLQKTKV